MKQKKLKAGVVFWQDALYSDFQKFPGLPNRVNASFGIIHIRKRFVEVGMNCDFGRAGDLLKIIDGIIIPKKTIIKIVQMNGFEEIFEN
ncbi:MAG: hypothetical protein A2418_01555 [Candidatus Brennerbacteria bacterium RIFOXYC1_FULL_41_11]|uniref:Uncharacterized protein n=1 Tax=Candidatus Brennerbacteria bacterium RIFOXYD1_FULL_41_16 TaxID=1797529 RepID=A0A1G1XJC8_9BACT|nr:MAG: hypothetical protein A2418_01555 [Candidatus Brennerbacteria bacterium RIFOXYC1_FULL_41_11]OGY39367.1 MAG: hypothetical protein A2391_02745 [Candidatus Brennerbacteria bacterium RIFOXYB1_FULL_41_13]OGY39994.1 MAG: hypothetical protein A2570_00695 [Candidatus Brennerbacteria bacterium RIFOXYD1_FULL_41_16]